MKSIMIVLLTSIFLSCSKSKCGDDTNDILSYYDAAFILRFVDQSGKSLMNDTGTGIDTASIRLYDINNNLLPRKFLLGGNTAPPYIRMFDLFVTDIFTEQDVTYKPLCKKLYIHFGNDRDTLEYCFNTVEAKCGPKIVDLQASFNGKIFYSGTPYIGSYIDGTIVK